MVHPRAFSHKSKFSQHHQLSYSLGKFLNLANFLNFTSDRPNRRFGRIGELLFGCGFGFGSVSVVQPNLDIRLAIFSKIFDLFSWNFGAKSGKNWGKLKKKSSWDKTDFVFKIPSHCIHISSKTVPKHDFVY